ncbi:MAG: energy-coupled thiamine transporter ThiT [Bacilli bacterium]|nr:energy-coupled thiamine transporter ThiT [Bacilli bacterium]
MINFSLEEIIVLGLLTGLHFVLNLPILKIYVPICLGTISFKTFPLFLIALNFSFLKSFITILFCAVFDWFLSGYPLYTFVFDYAVPYLIILILVSFKNKIISENHKCKNFIFGCVMFFIFAVRLFSHVVSGVLFYEVSFINAFLYNFPSCFANDCINFFLLLFFLKQNHRYRLIHEENGNSFQEL